MKLLIFGGELSSLNMEKVKGGGVLKYVGGLMDVVYGEVVIKGGRALLFIVDDGTCILFWRHVGGLGITPLKFSILSYMSV